MSGEGDIYSMMHAPAASKPSTLESNRAMLPVSSVLAVPSSNKNAKRCCAAHLAIQEETVWACLKAGCSSAVSSLIEIPRATAPLLLGSLTESTTGSSLSLWAVC